jgi:transcription initiation factor IIF auxiliary subunit
LGHSRWAWSVWLEGTPEELDSVDYVMYVLHPGFHNPVRFVSDRATAFRLETSGWGTFTIHAKAVHRDGCETPLHHELVLEYPDKTPAPA